MNLSIWCACATLIVSTGCGATGDARTAGTHSDDGSVQGDSTATTTVGANDTSAGMTTGAGGTGLTATSAVTGSGGTGGVREVVTDEDGNLVYCEYDDSDDDSLVDAVELDSISDCDEDAIEISDVSERDDVDYFSFTGTDELLCVVNPSASFSTFPYGVLSSHELEVCMFAECVGGGTSVECAAGELDTDGGRAGCCGVSVELSLSCDGSTDDADLFLRVSHLGPEQQCLPYKMQVHY